MGFSLGGWASARLTWDGRAAEEWDVQSLCVAPKARRSSAAWGTAPGIRAMQRASAESAIHSGASGPILVM